MRTMLRIALAKKRTGSPVRFITRIPAATLPIVRPLFNVSKATSYANTIRKNSTMDAPCSQPGDPEAPSPIASAMSSPS